MNEFKYEYLSGYIDGDGCFVARKTIQKAKNITVYIYSIEISSVDRDIIEYFAQEFGGVFSKRPEKRSNRRDSYSWVIKTKKSIPIAESIHNLLISKRNTCGFYMELSETIKPNAGSKISEEIILKRDEIIKKIKKEIHMNDQVTEEKFNSLKELKKSIEPSRANYAYLAGLIDAEGCFRIKHWQPKRTGRNRNYVVTLEIGNTKFSIFPWLIERFGGNLVYRKPTNQRHNPMIIWSLSSHALYQFLEQIYPFLRVKKERCKKIIEFHETSLKIGGDRNSEEFKNECKELQSIRQSLLEEFNILNAKGKH